MTRAADEDPIIIDLDAGSKDADAANTKGVTLFDFFAVMPTHG
ncbi:MAG: hypothetical protein ACLPKB_05865 [Xanthobacteraceae bacterium]